MHRPDIRELIRAVRAQMMIDFESKTKQIPHAGERGIGREDVLRSFLRDYLPDRFDVESGFVVDADRMVSGQIDVIIYDKLSAPVFRVTSSERLVPIESVSAIVSVKSFLGAGELADAVQNVRTVMSLDRFGSGRESVVYGGVPAPFQHDRSTVEGALPVFAAVFGYDSPSLESVAMNLFRANETAEVDEKVMLVCVLNKGVVTYVASDGQVRPTYDENGWVTLIEDPDLSLSIFYAMLANEATRRVPVSISMMRYLDFPKVPVRWIDDEGRIQPIAADT